jgi:hypothetical protein
VNIIIEVVKVSNIIKSEDGGLISIIGGKGCLELGKPFSKEIFLIDTHIAGTTYVDNIDQISDNLVKGTRLNFFREPDNKYDKLAIVIKDDEGNKVGYVPRKNNEIIARLMDAGKLIYGIVEDKEQLGTWLKIEMQIYLKD